MPLYQEYITYSKIQDAAHHERRKKSIHASKQRIFPARSEQRNAHSNTYSNIII